MLLYLKLSGLLALLFDWVGKGRHLEQVEKAFLHCHGWNRCMVWESVWNWLGAQPSYNVASRPRLLFSPIAH